jgi:lactate permease
LAPVGGSLAWSAIMAALPLLVLFVLLGVFKMKAWLASIITLLVSVILAMAVWGLPAETTLAAGSQGLFFGIAQIMWILLAAVWLYNLSVRAGWDQVLRQLLGGITTDLRVVAIIVAFCFGALLEALAGFGTPVAITAAMLVAAGMKPLKAAVVCMVANTAPVAFGAVGAPIITLATAVQSSFNQFFATAAPVSTDALASALGAMAGRLTLPMAILVPLFLVFLVDGWRGLKNTWGIALVSGIVFGVTQLVTSSWISFSLASVMAAVVSIIVLVVILRFYQPGNPVKAEPFKDGAQSLANRDHDRSRSAVGAARLWGALAPYAIIIVLFVITQLPPIRAWMGAIFGKLIHWPGLQSGSFPVDVSGAVIPQPSATTSLCGIVSQSQIDSGAALTSCTLGTVNLYSVLGTGTILFIGGLITAAVYRLKWSVAFGELWSTLKSLRFTIITIAAVLAIAYLLNASGMTLSLGTGLAASGGIFIVISPILGWLGVAITGSDTSANALFGGMQVTAANGIWPGSGQHAILVAAANTTGGVMGKMISPQSLSVASAAAGMPNREADIFRSVLGWSVVMVVIFALVVFIEGTLIPGVIPLPG